MHRGPEYAPIILAFIKDGLIQMLALMMIYGTLIPNRPSVVAADPGGDVRRPGRHASSRCGSIPTSPRCSGARLRGGDRLEHAVPGDRHGAGDLQLVPRERPAGRTDEARSSASISSAKSWAPAGSAGYLAEHQLLKRPLRLEADQARGGGRPGRPGAVRARGPVGRRLSHPNMIEIYDYGHTDDGTFYYVMEYLPGPEPVRPCRTTGPLPAGP